MTTFALALLGVCLVQAIIAPRLAIGGVQPDLFLILLFGLSVSVGPELAAAAGFLIGLYQDSLSGAPLGLNAFTLSLIGFLVSGLSEQVKTNQPAWRFALLCVAGLMSGIITLLLLRFFRAPRPLASAFLWTVLPGALYTGILGTGLLGALRAKIDGSVVR